MRFALIGNHPDGLAAARALVAAGHALAVTADIDVPGASRQDDVEEILADPGIGLVIVASPLGKRGQHLRRAAQSERDVLCVHPSDDRPDLAYEVSLIGDETKKTLTPLIAAVLHPAVARIIELLADSRFQLIEWRGFGEVPWPILRVLGGEIVEVSGLAPTEELDPGQPLMVAARFERGGMFQATVMPGLAERWLIHASDWMIEWDNQSLRHCRRDGEWKSESIPDAEVWASFAAEPSRRPTWHDEVRALELRDALRRSVEKRRASGLEHQEISEEVGSKGTLTLIGCGLIWVILLIFMASIWVPWIRWAIVPILLGFLVLLGMNHLAGKGKR